MSLAYRVMPPGRSLHRASCAVSESFNCRAAWAPESTSVTPGPMTWATTSSSRG